MREIKFRVWDRSIPANISKKELNKPTGMMLPWHYIKDSSYLSSALNGQYPIMQYTDEHDKNGKQACEGDIVIYRAFYNNKSDKTKEYIGQIVFRKSMFLIVDKDLKAIHAIEIPACEIIGNIYQNHELLSK